MHKVYICGSSRPPSDIDANGTLCLRCIIGSEHKFKSRLQSSTRGTRHHIMVTFTLTTTQIIGCFPMNPLESFKKINPSRYVAIGTAQLNVTSSSWVNRTV